MTPWPGLTIASRRSKSTTPAPRTEELRNAVPRNSGIAYRHRRNTQVGQQSGVYALVVDAKDDEAKRFYERYGFIAITNRPMTLCLPLGTGLKALQAVQS